MGVRRLAVANGPNIFQMLLVHPADGFVFTYYTSCRFHSLTYDDHIRQRVCAEIHIDNDNA